MQRETIDRSQQAIEQLLDLQRNMAQITLSAMQWQDTAQKQGMELMRSFPGQELTQSMLENYLEGMQTMLPEMERAIGRGMDTSQPDPPSGHGRQMGSAEYSSSGRMEQGGRLSRGERAIDNDLVALHEDLHRRGESAGPYSETPGRDGVTAQEYPQTGEWVTKGTYGGETAGRQRPQSDDRGRTDRPQSRGGETGKPMPPQELMAPRDQRATRTTGRERGGQRRGRGRRTHRQGQRRDSRGRQEAQEGDESSQPPRRRADDRGGPDRESRHREQPTQRIDTDDRGPEESSYQQPTQHGGKQDRREKRHGESERLESEREGMAQTDMDAAPEREQEEIDEESQAKQESE
ncbi:hypothetical protein [Natronobacterium gregoryi]|nr:hypothetical protein [Natronobacterium gregoryi]SFI82278.1 hypothetical protein SAMN05443661_10697 [Natronobacterium gregoryi]